MGSSGSSARTATNELESPSLVRNVPLSRPSLPSVTRPVPDIWSYAAKQKTTALDPLSGPLRALSSLRDRVLADIWL